MNKHLVAIAALVAAGALSIPDEASARAAFMKKGWFG